MEAVVAHAEAMPRTLLLHAPAANTYFSIGPVPGEFKSPYRVP